MKVLIVGLPYFSRIIQKDLASFDHENSYVSCDTYYSRWGKIKYVLHLLTADLVYSINGAADDSGSLSLARRLGKKVILQWVGTDVLKVTKKLKIGMGRKLIDHAIHFTEAPWLQEELKNINITSNILPLCGMLLPQTEVLEKTFSKFSVVSYIGKGREEFYGMSRIIEFAKRFQEIEINIVGIDKYDIPIPDNIRLLGWVSDLPNELKKHTLFLRLTEHDGLPNTILEALSLGLYIGWIYGYPGVHNVSDTTSLFKYVSELQKKQREGSLMRNELGIKFVRETYAKPLVLEKQVNTFKKILSV